MYGCFRLDFYGAFFRTIRVNGQKADESQSLFIE